MEPDRLGRSCRVGVGDVPYILSLVYRLSGSIARLSFELSLRKH